MKKLLSIGLLAMFAFALSVIQSMAAPRATQLGGTKNHKITLYKGLTYERT